MTDESLFAAAIAVDPAARAAILDRECADPAQRARLERLLAAHREDSFLEPPAAVTVPTDRPADADATRGADDTGTFGPAPGAGETGAAASPEAGLLAGRYKLIEPLGEGGMGTVYRAEQVHPVRRMVAVKLIKAGTDTARVIARFEAERQALAVMDHPNIARVLDGGVTGTGQPFFVMELVAGSPITTFADEKKLTIPQRLELFAQVCAAVQHAHQKGIIHRDLKPGNVLVTEVDGKPVPKVIDFGLAKALQAGAIPDVTVEQTGFGSVLGTPLYMAPEQADPGTADIDTRADVYALGVILYELLTGSTPHTRESFRKVALAEVLRMVREVDPPTPVKRLESSEGAAGVAAVRGVEPAKLARLVRGDLEWVTMKALAKERERRYESATALADDVARFLNHEPVTAGPPGRWYRARKFVRRNRAAVTAASVVFLALVAGVVGTTLGLMEADAQRRYAEGQEAKAKGETAEKEKALAEQTRLRGEEEKARKELEVAFASRQYDDLVNIKQQADPVVHTHNLVRILKTLPEEAKELRFHTKLQIALEFGLYGRWAQDLTGTNETVYYHLRNNEAICIRTDGTVALAHPLTGQPRVTLAAPNARLTYLTHTDHADLLVAGLALGAPPQTNVSGYYFFDTRSGRLLGQTPADRVLQALDLSPDGTRFLTREETRINPLTIRYHFHLWDTATGRLVAEIPPAVMLTLSRDNRFVVAFGDQTHLDPKPGPVRVYSARDGKLVHSIPVTAGRYMYADVTPDGRHLVTFTNDEVRWWRTADWQPVGPPSRTENNRATDIFTEVPYQFQTPTHRFFSNVRYFVRNHYAVVFGQAGNTPGGIVTLNRLEVHVPGEPKPLREAAADELRYLADKAIVLRSGRVITFDPVRILTPTRYRRYPDEARAMAVGGRFLPPTVENLYNLAAGPELSDGVGAINFAAEKTLPQVVIPVTIDGGEYYVARKENTYNVVPATLADLPDDLLTLWVEVETCGRLDERNQFVLWDEPVWEAKRADLARRIVGRPEAKLMTAAATDVLRWTAAKVRTLSEPDEVTPYLDRLVRDDPHPEHLVTRAYMWLKKADLDRTAADLREALRLHRLSPERKTRWAAYPLNMAYRPAVTGAPRRPDGQTDPNQFIWPPVVELLCAKNRPRADYELAREWLDHGPMIYADESPAWVPKNHRLEYYRRRTEGERLLAAYRLGEYRAVTEALLRRSTVDLQVALTPIAFLGNPLASTVMVERQRTWYNLAFDSLRLSHHLSVILAMTEYQLGRTDIAARRLGPIREVVFLSPRLLAEAKELIGPAPKPPVPMPKK